MSRITRRLHPVPDRDGDEPPPPEPPPSPPDGEFFRSNTARVYADDKGFGRMQLQAVLCFPCRFPALGLPTWTTHEADIVRFLMLRGRPPDYAWTALRGGQQTVNKSLAHELCLHLSHIARALARLKRRRLVAIGVSIKGRHSIRLTERMHELAVETQWRVLLWDTDPQHVAALARTPGWQRLLEQVDHFFQRNRSKHPTRFEDRHHALHINDAATTL